MKKTAVLVVLCMLLSVVPVFAAPEEAPQGSLQDRIAKILEDPTNTQVEKVVPGNVYIPAEVKFEVELVNELSSKKCKTGDNVDLRMLDNLIINGVIVVPKGTIGRATVADARKAGGLGRKGKLTVTPLWIKTVNGVEVPFKADEFKSVGRSDGGAVAVAAAISLVGGIFMKGTNASYPAGSKFVVEVRENVDLNTTSDKLAAVMDMNQVRGTQIQVAVAAQ